MRGLMDLEGIKGETLSAAAPRCPVTLRGCDVVLDGDFYVVSLTDSAISTSSPLTVLAATNASITATDCAVTFGAGAASPTVALSTLSLTNASLSVTNGATDGVLTVDDLVVSAAAPVFYDLGDTTAVTVRRVCLTAPSLVLHTASLRIAGAESVCGSP